MTSKGRAVQGVRTHASTTKGVQRSFPGGRACRECGEQLSQYNPGPNCWRHTQEHPWRGPTARPR